MTKQKTISSPITISGVGLHSGEDVKLTLEPTSENEGIIIERSDLSGDNCFSLSPMVISRGERRTVLSNGHASVNTIEHLLAALHITGITNLKIILDKEELPGVDGSSLPYIEEIEKVGIKELNADISPIKITQPLVIDRPEGTLTVLPSDKGCEIDYTLDYQRHNVTIQHEYINLNGDTDLKDIAQCRTFCMKEEWAIRHDHGFGKGASYENTLVMDGDSPIENSLRTDHELAKHKMLDLIGDLYILGRPIEGKFIALKSGHATNVAMVKDIFDNFSTAPITVETIKEILPHRFPFLMVDRITHLVPGKLARGYKNLTYNEQFFQGHFPNRPVMPGVLQVEAMAQLAGSTLLNSEAEQKLIPMFTAMEKVKFRRQVVPGDKLEMETTITKFRRQMGEVSGKAYVNGELASEANFRFVLVEDNE